MASSNIDVINLVFMLSIHWPIYQLVFSTNRSHCNI